MLAFGPAWGILFNVFIYLPLTLWLWKAPYGPAFRAGPRAPGRAISGLADILATLRSIASDRTILSTIVLAGCASFLVGNAHQAQMPEFSRDLGHDGGLHYSALLAAGTARTMALSNRTGFCHKTTLPIISWISPPEEAPFRRWTSRAGRGSNGPGRGTARPWM